MPILDKLLLELCLSIPQRRTRLALCLESDAALARLVVVSLAAEFLGVTSVAGLADDGLGHGFNSEAGGPGKSVSVGKPLGRGFKKERDAENRDGNRDRKERNGLVAEGDGGGVSF